MLEQVRACVFNRVLITIKDAISMINKVIGGWGGKLTKSKEKGLIAGMLGFDTRRRCCQWGLALRGG